MTLRIPFILGALATIAFASPAWSDHHETTKGQAKQLEKAQKDKAMKRADQARDDAKEHADAAREEVEETRDQAEERAKKAKEQAKKTEARGETAKEGLGEEMRSRRDERKAIMEDAKSDAEGAPRKGKKSWWRFWESDDA